MRYQLFGRSGLRVSELCLGTMTFGTGESWTADAAASRAMFDAFAEAGGTFIDTADAYTGGLSEQLVGEFVRTDRDRFVVATKYSQGAHISTSGNSRRNMVRAVEASLRRLGTDRIDLYWLHLWDYTTPVEEVMRAFDDLVSAGKVLYVAASDMPAWEISRANMLAELRGWAPLAGIQVEYNLLQRTAERDLLPMARALDLGVTAWSPLAGGMLTGKYASTGDSPRGQAWRLKPLDARKTAIVAELVEVARDVGRSPSQVALAWVRQARAAAGVIPIIGARKVENLQDSLACLDLVLDEATLARLDAASAVELGFPHDMLRSPNVRALTFGGGWDRLKNPRDV